MGILAIKWSEDGSTVLDRHIVSVRRENRLTAKKYIQAKFPLYFVELNQVYK